MLSDAYIGLFLTVAVCSILLTTFVCLNILKFGARTVSSRLILYINLTILADSIASLPNVYVDSFRLCQFMAFVKSYSELVNISVAFLMAVLAYNITFRESSHSRFVLTNSMNFVLFLFPMFLVVPLSENFMGNYADHWCSFNDSKSGADWFLAILAFDFVLLLIIICFFAMFAIKLYVTKRASMKSMVKGVGLYSVITVVGWLPRVLIVNSLFPSVFSVDVYMFISRLSIYITGILYGVVFLKEKNSLRIFGCRSWCCPRDYELLGRLTMTEAGAIDGDLSEFDHTEGDQESFYAESGVNAMRDRLLLSAEAFSDVDIDPSPEASQEHKLRYFRSLASFGLPNNPSSSKQ